MTVYESDYAKVLYKPDENIVEQYWLPATEDMDDDEYQRIQLATLKAFVDNEVELLFVDTQNMAYPIEPEMQQWSKEEIMDKLLQTKFRKVAYIVSQDFLSQVSIEQTVNEDTSNRMVAQYFDNAKDAREWLYGTTA